MIKEYWNLIGQEPFLAITWEPDFSQACSFRRMLMNHKNFHFTQIPDKTNDVIFLKSPNTMFWGHFWPFLPDGDFFQKIQLSHTTIYGLLTLCWVSEKNNEPIPRKIMGRWKEGQKIVFIGPLPPRPWVKQPLFSKWLLGIHQIREYFLKIPPLKKILQF